MSGLWEERYKQLLAGRVLCGLHPATSFSVMTSLICSELTRFRECAQACTRECVAFPCMLSLRTIIAWSWHWNLGSGDCWAAGTVH